MIRKTIEQLFRRKPIDLLDESESEGPKLLRTLNLRDLTFMSIAAIVGAGIFGTIGSASASGGPAVSLLFVFTAMACLCSALCYAEFASSVPYAGSAYTYAYVSFGEIIAWIIGWDLLMEYAIGNIAVAISWSDYFTGFLNNIGIKIPSYLTMDYFSAYNSYNSMNDTNSGDTWLSAPEIGGFKIIFDLPALLITIVITLLVFIGIKESKSTSNVLVFIKLFVMVMIIIIGLFYVNTDYWTPFAPHGISGVLKGVSSVFFAYIGFDAISTTAEECKDPKKDLPKAMFISLFICTILYVAITLILTGLVPYYDLNIGDPLAYAFNKVGLNFISGIVALSAIVAMTSVLLVFQLGQPRIWMSMSRDGLLPKIFSRIHPRFKTPSFSTIVTGLFVAIPSMFMNLTEVTDLCSIGTLFAFTIVCGGILVMPSNSGKNGFQVPFINGKFIIPFLFLILSVICYDNIRLEHLDSLPFLLFYIIFFIISILTYVKNLSLIPVLGLLINLYLMSVLGWTNWLRFLLWLLAGLIIYFCFGKRNSKLKNP